MKKKNLIVFLASTLLVLVLVATGCTVNAATAPTKEKSFACLSPLGIQPPVQISPLAARLDTLDGKVIYVNQGEADPIIMPALWERVQKDYPKTTWKYIASSSFGPAAPEDEVKTTAKAVLRGIAW